MEILRAKGNRFRPTSIQCEKGVYGCCAKRTINQGHPRAHTDIVLLNNSVLGVALSLFVEPVFLSL